MENGSHDDSSHRGHRNRRDCSNHDGRSDQYDVDDGDIHSLHAQTWHDRSHHGRNEYGVDVQFDVELPTQSLMSSQLWQELKLQVQKELVISFNGF